VFHPLLSFYVQKYELKLTSEDVQTEKRGLREIRCRLNNAVTFKLLTKRNAGYEEVFVFYYCHQLFYPEWLQISHLTTWLRVETFTITSFNISAIGFFIWRLTRELFWRSTG